MDRAMTTRGQKPYRDAIERVLAEHGIRKFRYEMGGKHMRCIFMLPDGVEHYSTFPTTPSDYRGAKNKASEVRHQLRKLGVMPLEKRK
jgi:capsule polysaccharide modification protein KpsS